MNSSKTIVDYLDKNEELDLDKIIADFSPYVKTIINNMSNNNLTQEDKEEILLDTFFVLWKNQDKIIILDSYIAGITRNLVKEKMKKKKITYDIADYENIAEYSKIDLFFEERDEIYNKSIQIIYYDDTKETIEGNWKFNVKISDEMRRKTANIYNISENNEYIENCTVTVSNTGTIVELNSKVEIPDITYEKYGVAIMDLIHLKDNEKTYEPSSVEHNENYMKIVFEDVGNFIVNSDKLELHLDWFNTIIKLNKNIIE